MSRNEETTRILYFKRILYIMMIITAVLGLFYLYIPPHTGVIQRMNKTIGSDKADVVCVGSSHVFSSIIPAQMYTEEGIAAYDLAIGAQAPWQSFFYIKAAYRYQHPKLIILDVYVYARDDISDLDDHIAVRNMLDYPLSVDKWRGIMASDAENPLGLMFRFPYIYNDYEHFDHLTLDKYRSEPDIYLGYVPNTDVVPYSSEEITDVTVITDRLPIHEKCEKYLRYAIEYCESRGIDIILVNAPWPENNNHKAAQFNYIRSIADEYGILFLDGCIAVDEIGMDWSLDSYGDGGHLNTAGATKYTFWLDNYLSDNFRLPDRRGDIHYRCYEEAASIFAQQSSGY